MSYTVNDAVNLAVESGLCVVPPVENGDKKPDGSWKRYQSERPSPAQLARWYQHDGRAGIGIVCGKVSGGLEMLELEGRAYVEGIAEQFNTAAIETGLGDVLARIQAGYCETTPGGGVHLLYCCDVVSGNLKLARRPATAVELEADPEDKVKVLIETRGEGGYTITAPSNGKVHPSGGRWELDSGGFDTIATITPEERDDLHALCRTFDRMPVVASSGSVTTGSGSNDDAPGADYSHRGDVPALLDEHGWVRVFDHGNDSHWRRPGKNTGTSAVWHADSRMFVVFSTSTMFQPERGYNPFAVCTILTQGSDSPQAFSAAAKELRAAGWGREFGTRAEVDLCARADKQPVSARAGESPLASGDSGAPVLPDEFWNARPVLGHIRTAARSRLIAPDALMGAVLARVCAMTDYRIVLPPKVGTVGSLNTITAVVGVSGAGKGSANAESKLLLEDGFHGNRFVEAPAGSGEGMVALYFEKRPTPTTSGSTSSCRRGTRRLSASTRARSSTSSATATAKPPRRYSVRRGLVRLWVAPTSPRTAGIDWRHTPTGCRCCWRYSRRSRPSCSTTPPGARRSGSPGLPPWTPTRPRSTTSSTTRARWRGCRRRSPTSSAGPRCPWTTCAGSR
jgi:hypothetical protein